MKTRISLIFTACMTVLPATAQRPDTLWYRFDDRFTAPKAYNIADYDTIVFGTASAKCYKPDGAEGVKSISYNSTKPGRFQFTDPGRYLFKPSSMNCDFTKESSQWCFARSKESEHFVCFWENGANFDVDNMLAIGEKCWDVYTTKLGFVKEGESSTDKYKVIMRVYNTSDWVASGSGEDLKVGTFQCSPWAVSSRGGATVAHEIGHTFQYLTNVDCGANNTHGFNYGLGPNAEGGNGFWEDCANWMAYKVYPERQFTDGEYFEQYLDKCHLNIMHESARYTNCFYQDYLCEKFGQDFIGRIWREATRPEDPVDAIKRMEGLSHEEFSAMMYDCFAHMCTWDVNSIRNRARHRWGAHGNHLESVVIDGEQWFQVKPERCPQNYGYNITRLDVPAAGTEVKVRFQGFTGAEGYRTINKLRAGWRYGLVAAIKNNKTIYGEMQSDKEGTATIVVPENCTDLWLVVMGCPTQWWHHAWDDNESNDEQWPYRVQVTGSKPYGLYRVYTSDDFPADFVPRDTTVIINAKLAYNSGSYTSVNVQYNTDAISEALGLTTEQLHSIVRNSTDPYFCGVNKSGTTSKTLTSTSNDQCFGHWFTTSETVCGYDNSAAIFAEMYPATFVCKVGQYPGRLSTGKTYIIRQAVVHQKKKAIMEVHLNIY